MSFVILLSEILLLFNQIFIFIYKSIIKLCSVYNLSEALVRNVSVTCA